MPPAETQTTTTALAKPTRPPPTAEDVMRLAHYAAKLAGVMKLQAADREDIVSELQLFGLKQAASHDASRAAFTTHYLKWAILKAVAWRKNLLDWRRKGGAWTHLFSEAVGFDQFDFAIEDNNFSAVDIRDSAIGVAKIIEEAIGEREQGVLMARIMDDMTLEEIGVRLGITKERVRQIEERAKYKIRRAIMGIK